MDAFAFHSLCPVCWISFFLPFNLFKKGRAVIHWLIDKVSVDYSNARLAIMAALVLCLCALMLEGTSANARLALLFPTWFIVGIMAVDGLKRANS